VFLDFREQFLIYGEYCSKMIEASDTLRDVCKRSAAIEQLVAVSRIDVCLMSRKSIAIYSVFVAMSEGS